MQELNNLKENIDAWIKDITQEQELLNKTAELQDDEIDDLFGKLHNLGRRVEKLEFDMAMVRTTLKIVVNSDMLKKGIEKMRDSK